MHLIQIIAVLLIGTFHHAVMSAKPWISLKPTLDGRIVGGQPVDITNYPYQVSLQSWGHICGGTIISKKWILTASHCTSGQKPSGLKIRVGSTQHSRNGTLHNVKQIIRHELYDSWVIDWDYSLLELENEIELGPDAQPIDLNGQDDPVADGSLVVVTGWGNTQNNSESRDDLRAATIPVVKQSDCHEAYASFGGITDRMICAGLEEGGRDACQGDSGGPLVGNGKLVGVVSWGYGCAKPHYPGVYARVSVAREWIRGHSGV